MNNKKQFNLKSKSGMILISTTMGVFILLSLFAFYLARFSITENRTGGYYLLDIKARNLALVGLEHSLELFKTSRDTVQTTGRLNKGDYKVKKVPSKDEKGNNLSRTNYYTIKSIASIDDVERKVRCQISSMPEAFSLAFFGQNFGNSTLNSSLGTIIGDIYYNGDISSGGGTDNGINYTSTGVGGTAINNQPIFPNLDLTQYETLLLEAQLSSGSYDNKALNFDGNNDYVKIENSADINTGNNHTQKTVEAWFKVDNKDITSKKQVVYEQGGTVRGLNIYIYGGSLYVGGWNEAESQWNPGTWLSTNNIESNTWHHVALTLNGGSTVTSNAFKGYLNGVQFGVGQGSKLWGHGGDIAIGRNRDTKFHTGDYNSQKYFDGVIDEVRLWNIERTQNQISAKKDTVLEGNESGLTAYYNFQENSGSTANDSQLQSNNDGSIQNGADWTTGPALSKMNNNSYVNVTINLSSYPNNKLLANNDLNLNNVVINGPGYVVAYGDININSSTQINGNVSLVSNEKLIISSSNIGSSLNNSVIAFSKGDCEITGSTFYGLTISKGSKFEIQSSNYFGAILNESLNCNLKANANIVGSIVSKYSISITDQSVSLSKGDLPLFIGQDIGLKTSIVPGSYLEY